MSVGVVTVLIPATIFGLNIGTAVLFHEGSTLLVVVNVLRLLAYRDARPGHSRVGKEGKSVEHRAATGSMRWEA